MAAITSEPVERSYEQFVAEYTDRFGAYLRGVLGRQGEGRGGRIGVEDALQEALMRVYENWAALQELADEERNRLLYRYLRDAAVQALRAEHGRRDGPKRPRLISVDFAAIGAAGTDRSMAEREFEAQVLGTMANELCDDGGPDAKAVLDRAIVVGGLRALDEQEAVVLLAVDHLDWDQERLAEQLGMSARTLRRRLHDARRLFYSLIHHAVGVEVGDEERGRLAALLAGELSGREKREVQRHLRHCDACQQLEREQLKFQRVAVQILSPLPFVFGARLLAKRAPTKLAVVGSGVGPGLFAQPGAAKAAAAVMGVLAIGGGAVAVIGQVNGLPVEHAGPSPVVSAGLAGVTTTMGRPEPAVVVPAHRTRPRHRARRRAHYAAARPGGSRASTTSTLSQPRSAGTGTATPPSGTTGGSASRSRTSSSTSSGNGSFLGE
ncbi:sigma-70 family RNA polymerase sigma factor [Conexibacter woesei]|uniref:sigma-70 family RNA polymerase sigma factor n=1 Tax=Conexibacter woesei TaxID=191495 RepID=UPI00041689FC|nr:sigma-70 family RNA polymerase sigma factor [Conexibacter woesei]